MNFCSHCGSAHIEHRTPEGDNRLRFICNDCQTIHYQNPRIIVGCLVLWQERQLLLGKREIEPRAGKWNLPAGFMEQNESTQEGAIREVWEETGARVEMVRLHAIYHAVHVHQVHIIYLARLLEPIFAAKAETLDVQLFDLDAVPFDELAFLSNVFSIRTYLNNPHYQGVHIGDSRQYKGDKSLLGLV